MCCGGLEETYGYEATYSARGNRCKREEQRTYFAAIRWKRFCLQTDRVRGRSMKPQQRFYGRSMQCSHNEVRQMCSERECRIKPSFDPVWRFIRENVFRRCLRILVGGDAFAFSHFRDRRVKRLRRSNPALHWKISAERIQGGVAVKLVSSERIQDAYELGSRGSWNIYRRSGTLHYGVSGAILPSVYKPIRDVCRHRPCND